MAKPRRVNGVKYRGVDGDKKPSSLPRPNRESLGRGQGRTVHCPVCGTKTRVSRCSASIRVALAQAGLDVQVGAEVVASHRAGGGMPNVRTGMPACLGTYRPAGELPTVVMEDES